MTSTAVPSTSSAPRSTRTRRPSVADRGATRPAAASGPSRHQRGVAVVEARAGTRRAGRPGRPRLRPSARWRGHRRVRRLVAASPSPGSSGQATHVEPDADHHDHPLVGRRRPGQPAEIVAPAGQSASARIPASLRSPSAIATTRSLGHLSPGVDAGDRRDRLGHAPPPAAIVTALGRPRPAGAAAPTPAATRRRRLPGPAEAAPAAVWWSATTTTPSGAPSRAEAEERRRWSSRSRRPSARRRTGGRPAPPARSPAPRYRRHRRHPRKHTACSRRS